MSPQSRKRIYAVLAGFAGGLAPFIVNLAQALVGNAELPTTPTISYVIGILIFGVVGAVVPLLFRELNLKKAFFLGISAPAIISVAAKGGARRGGGAISTRAPSNDVSFSLISSAYAQTEPIASASRGNVRVLEIQLNGTMPEAVVAFLDVRGNELKAVRIRLHQFERVLVPAAAVTVIARYGDSVTDAYPLLATADHPQYVEVTGTGGEKKLDISSAFTGQPKILYDIKIAEAPTVALPTGQIGWVYMGTKSAGRWQTRYLDFSADRIVPGTIVRAGVDLTMRNSPSKDAGRIGRVKSGQRLKFLQSTNIAEGAQPNNSDADGDFYAQVEVQ